MGTGKESEHYSGGYRKLKTYQLSQLVYDITVYFVEQYIELDSRTRDQMVQAARSCVQNIVEGSIASAENKKTELKLTNVARASLGELMTDYQDFLRQHGEKQWTKDHKFYKDFVRLRVNERTQFQDFVNQALAESTSSEWPHLRKNSQNRNEFILATKIPVQAWIICNAVLLLSRSADYMLMKQLDYLRRNIWRTQKG